MKYFILLSLLFLFSCKQRSKKVEVAPGDSLVIRSSGPADSSPIKKTSSVPDTTIYSNYIPARLAAFIRDEHKEWSIPAPAKWESYWWDEYKKDSSLVNIVTGDFNCDSKNDHALILTDQRGNIAAWAFLAKEIGYNKVKLDEFENISSGPIGIGLESLEPGRHGDLNGDTPSTVQVKCEGVTIIYFEKAARSYYWENGKLKWIQTGD